MSWVCPICSTANESSGMQCFVCAQPRSLHTLPPEAMERAFQEARLLDSRGDAAGAFAMYRALARGKHLPAILAVADCYRRGSGTAPDPVQMYKAYVNGARRGDAEAQYQLALCCYRGTGTARSLERTVLWLNKALAQDHIQAVKLYASLYENGEGVEKDVSRAFQLYTQANALCGGEDAQILEGLARCDRVLRQERWLAKWFQAEAGDARAQYELAVEASSGVRADMDKAISWLLRSARQEYAPALMMLAQLYQKGRGVEQDFHEAISLYRRARAAYAADGSRKEQYGAVLGIGYCLYGLERNILAAIHYKIAARGGNAEAQYALAACYEAGCGVFKSQKKADKLYMQSAENGYAPAWDKALF